MALSAATPPSVDDIIEQLHTLLPTAQLEADTDVFAAGFDSLRIMRFAGMCRKAGYSVSFADLLAEPTPNSWVKLLGTATSAPARATADTATADTASTGASPDTGESFRLAPLQHAYWAGGMGSHSASGAGAADSEAERLGGVSAHLFVELDGPDHDVDKLAVAVAAVMARHDMLRAVIQPDGTQRISAQVPPVFSHRDLRGAKDDSVAEELGKIRKEMSSQRAATDLGRMIDVRFTRLPGGRGRLHVDFDMLAGDAMSYRIVLDDLAAVFEGEELPPLRARFRDYLAAPEVVSPKHRGRDQLWWEQRLDTLPDPPKLPTLAHVPARAVEPTRRHLALTPAERGQLERNAQAHGLTPATCLAAAFAHAVGCFAAQSRFVLNVPLFHREQIIDGIDQVVGDFSSSVLVSVDMSRPMSVVEHIRAVAEDMHLSMQHSDWSALDVLRQLSKRRGTQVVAPVVYTSAVGLGELFSPRVRRVFGDPVWIVSEGPQVLLDAQVTELDGGLLANWDVREGLFLPGVVDAMFAAYEANARVLIDSADWSGRFPSAVPNEQQIARARSETMLPAAGDAVLHASFFEWADATPNAPAVLWGEDGVRSYAELRDAALAVATSLRGAGVRRGDVVGVRVAKGPDQVTALLGVLAAGAAWVPVGADQPAARRQRILSQAGARVVLHDESVAHDLDAGVGAVLLSDAVTTPIPTDACEYALQQSPDDLVYVLFTSGSTGSPKGVELTHRAVLNTITAVNSIVGLAADDRTLALSSLEFDLSVHDIFGPLAVGGAVVTVSEGERRDAEAWVKRMTQHQVTQLYCVPPLLDMLLSSTATTPLDSLRWCLLGGDWVTLDLPARLRRRASHCRFAGLGGATETAIHSTFFEVTDPDALDPHWGSVPFGYPLPNMRARIVDDAGRIRPDYAPGEYLVSGPGIARGYRGDTALTEQKFPEIAGTRWYRTNDLARYLPGGIIEFLGRRDDQVKIRGYRIELGEVEAALRATPGVLNGVVVTLRSDAHGDQAPRLAAVAAVAEATTTEDDVAATLGLVLPPYMIPEVFVLVDTLPVNSNGKVDRTQCAQLAAAALSTVPATHEQLPQPGTLEALVAGVFAEVIGVDKSAVGLDADFIQVGGDSVLSTKAMSLMRDVLDNDELPAALLFDSRTPRSLAAALRVVEPEPGLFDRTAEIVHELAQDNPTDAGSV